MTVPQPTVKPYSADGNKKEQVADMFNNISGTYDMLNRFMTMGIDIIWRKKAIRSLRSIKPQRILDVATGTGDFAIESIKILNPEKIVGLDISEGMLSVAKEKIQKKGLSKQFEVMLGDSESLPFEDNSFDAVTVAFGVRNFEHLQKGLDEINRVIRPGGKAIVLELSNPTAFPIKQLFHFYFHKFTPAMGRLISKDHRAYSYLPESVAQFPSGKVFAGMMQQAGFSETKVRPQTFGFCTIYESTK
ncbi:bifunctional demethylmenaquinone methyltransferase/2-methoxy-6-polyprenyl-1,4-benzoquinol methylase UbiE [Sphingobacterium corticis]|uniref:Demethylmenaquinone methyltransferase n=1 Tax=Sphingobacterium corticis TaxID=1812823 RepID=A0ABW5NI27_9SPHI